MPLCVCVVSRVDAKPHGDAKDTGGHGSNGNGHGSNNNNGHGSNGSSDNKNGSATKVREQKPLG